MSVTYKGQEVEVGSVIQLDNTDYHVKMIHLHNDKSTVWQESMSDDKRLRCLVGDDSEFIHVEAVI